MKLVLALLLLVTLAFAFKEKERLMNTPVDNPEQELVFDQK
jgi:hypothetical protein